ncbi:Ribosome maturation factor RimM [Buchnera aphidicola (Cinara pseudotaxifoliae)]|uniref:Ribosome maturation factor RimM n=1 Tax=Buchnera aphidicola (Cinara pseudotaxifoliae) TaxID=655384 RepID=A0A451DHD2_9GAMM|nr:ribosome maturation factor RimM [Buchnera aphidicola]VFP86018.1 Ribosome maturation factor RimM [Buchnera aphidicola (Cinara pseudotaxifoliae)]
MIIIGKIGNPYGILGWIHIHSFTEKKENIFRYLPWKLEKSNIYVYEKDIIRYKKHKNNFLVKLDHLHDRTQAYLMAKQNILIKSIQLPKLQKNEYYWNNILLCKIFNEKKELIGSVKQILDNKIYNILNIFNSKKNKNIYVPFIQPKIIKKIDIKKKIIIVNWSLCK